MNSGSNRLSGTEAGLPQRLASRLAVLAPPKPWWVAFSGGPDSLALLTLIRERHPDVAAVHVDHGLHPDSYAWAQWCRELAARLDVTIRVEAVDVRHSREGLEGSARQARYRVFEAILADGGSLFMAHHADDQAETQLFRLVRGSGLAGLAGMPVERALGHGRLVRPLLGEPRAALQRQARASGLPWLTDPSNDDLARDRNFLRHRVIPALAERWPDAAQRLASSASDARRNLDLLNALVDHWLAPGGTTMPLAALREHGEREREWLVRQWLARQGVRAPGRHRLAQGVADLLGAGADADPVLAWDEAQLRRHGDALVLLPPELPGAFEAATGLDSSPLSLSDGSLLAFERRAGGLTSAVLAGGWQVMPRQGGERLRHHGHSRPVKKLLQEADRPAWEKRHFPLLWVAGALAALPGVAVADGCRARVGWWPIWTPPWRRDD